MEALLENLTTSLAVTPPPASIFNKQARVLDADAAQKIARTINTLHATITDPDVTSDAARAAIRMLHGLLERSRSVALPQMKVPPIDSEAVVVEPVRDTSLRRRTRFTPWVGARSRDSVRATVSGASSSPETLHDRRPRAVALPL